MVAKATDWRFSSALDWLLDEAGEIRLRRIMDGSGAKELADGDVRQPQKFGLFIAYPESRYLNFMPVPALDEIAVIITRNDSLNHMSLSKDELLTPDLWTDN